jgi:hypothetical protein
MARQRKSKPHRRRSGGPSTEPRSEGPFREGRPAPPEATPSDGWTRPVAALGWLGLAAGALGALASPGSIAGAVSASTALAGTLTAVAVGFYRDRGARRAGLPRRRSPVAFPLGTLLLLGGTAALLYPCFVTREALHRIAEAYTYGPLVAVAFLFSGATLLIDGVDRHAPSEPELAVPDPQTLRERAAFFNPLQVLLVPAALFVPRLWSRIPIVAYLRESWAELDREAARAREARAKAGETGYDRGPIAVLCSGAVFLSLMEYFGHAPTLHELVDGLSDPADPGPLEPVLETVRSSAFYHGRHQRSGLIEFAWWSGWRVLGFFLLPALVIKVLLRGKILDHGLQTRGFWGHAWIYVGFFAYVLVAVLVVSYDDHFQTYYPFYEQASRSWFDFWTWELLYAAQFFSLEFFFRGFWLKASKNAMGSHAIYAMVGPYCMIHFGKPFPETLAAILAGVVLGTLALRTRSIWAGFLIHVSVALSMDVAALLQTTGLPERWWPAL